MVQDWFDNLHRLVELETQREAVWWAMIAALAAIASVVVSGFALVGLFRSLAQTRESLLENKRTGILERRPWIVITDIKFLHAYIDTESDEKHLIISLKITVENTGVLPAGHSRVVAWIGGMDAEGSEGLLERSLAERPHDHVDFPPRALSGYEDLIRFKLTDEPNNEPAFFEVSVLYRGAESSEIYQTTALAAVERDDGDVIRIGELLDDYPLAKAGTIAHLTLK